MKKTIILLASLFMVFGLYGKALKIGVLNGPSCVPVAYIMDQVSNSGKENYEFEKFSEAYSLVPKLTKGEIDVAFLPPNVAAKSFNAADSKLVCAAISGQGNLSLITKDKEIHRFSDLKGKTVYVAGQGATPEYLFRYLLKKNHLEKHVKLDFSVPTAQIAAQLISGRISYAVVPEPFATVAAVNSDQVIKAIDMQKEYRKVVHTNENYPLTLIVFSKNACETKKNQLVEFLSDYENAYNWTITNPDAAALLCENFQLGLKAPIVKKSIPNANYVYISAKNGKTQVEKLLQIFLDFDPSSIAYKLPEQNFYFEK